MRISRRRHKLDENAGSSAPLRCLPAADRHLIDKIRAQEHAIATSINTSTPDDQFHIRE